MKFIGFIFLLFLSPSLSSAKTYEDITKQVSAQWGPVVPSENIPYIISILLPHFDRISKAQIKIINPTFKIKNEIRVVDSAALNAFVFTLKRQTEGTNLLFITTGMLEFYLRKGLKPEEAMEIGFSELDGIMAHELGHPIDKFAADGIENHYGSTASSHTIEFRADLEGRRLLKLSDLPQDAIYNALKRLQPLRTKPRLSFLSSHPEDGLRQNVSELALTEEFFEHGESPVRSSRQINAEAVLKELATMSYSKKIAMAIPKTLREAFAQLLKLLSRTDIPLDDLGKRVQFNALLLFIDQNFAKLDPNSSESKSKIDEFRTVMQQGALVYPYFPQLLTKPSELKMHFTQSLADISWVEEFKTHGSYLRELAVYKYWKPRDWFKAQDYGPPYAIMVLDKTVDPQTLVDGILNFMENNWPQSKVEFTRYLGHQLESIVGNFSAENRVRFFISMHQRIVPYLIAQKDWYTLSYLNKTAMLSLMYLESFRFQQSSLVRNNLVSSSPSEEAPFVALLKLESRAYPHGETSKMLQDLKGICEEIWQNRGLYAFLEVSTGLASWALVSDVLEIDPDQMKTKIRRSLAEFLTGKLETKMAPHEFAKDGGFQFLDWTQIKPFWMDPKTIGFLKKEIIDKEKDEQIANNLRDRLISRWLRVYIDYFKSATEKEMNLRVTKIPESKLSAKDLAEMQKEILKEYVGVAIGYFPLVKLPEFIDAATISDGAKKKLLQDALFNRDVSGPYLDSTQPEDVKRYFTIAKKRKLVESVLEFSNRLITANMRIVDAYGGNVLNLLSEELLLELDGIFISTRSQSSQLKVFNQYVEALAKENIRDTSKNRSTIKVIEKLLQVGTTLNLSVDEKFDLYLKLAYIQNSPFTDRFFIEQVEGGLDLKNALTLKQITECVKRKIFYSEKLQTKMLEKTLSLSDKPTPERLKVVSDAIAYALPQSSVEKDALLEKVAWIFQPENKALIEHIEDQKVKNWRRNLNPKLVIGISLLSDIGNYVSLSDKMELIEYLLHPKDGFMPSWLESKIEKINLVLMRARTDIFRYKYEADNQTSLRKHELQKFVRSLTLQEKVPVLLWILSNGTPSLLDNPGKVLQMRERFLKMKQDSIEDIALISFLKVAPNYAKSAAMAYLLAMSEEKNGESARINLKVLCEIFKVVGIKIGQIGGILNIFGEEHAEEVKDLQDRVSPMTLFDLQEQVAKTLPAKEVTGLKHIQILGSASIKTVELVQLKSGKYGALMVKRPDANNNTRTTMKMAKAFLDELATHGKELNHPLFKPLLESLDDQLNQEMNFLNEVENYKILAEVARTQVIQPSGWEVRVPKVLDDITPTEDIFLTEAIHPLVGVAGRSWKEILKDPSIDRAVKEEIGEAIARFSLSILFQHGLFEADRHPGNWLVDLVKKKIYLIDPGQLINFSADKRPWKWDPRLTISGFMKSYADKNAAGLIHYASLMIDPKRSQSFDKDKLEREIDKILKSNTIDERVRITEVMSKMYVSGLYLDSKFTFGVIKGFLILMNSSYISMDRFKTILSSEIIILGLKKTPVVARETYLKLKNVLKNKPFCTYLLRDLL